MQFNQPDNSRVANFGDVFTGETEEEMKLILGIRYHEKLRKSSIWTDEKVTGPETNPREFLSLFNQSLIYIVIEPLKIDD